MVFETSIVEVVLKHFMESHSGLLHIIGDNNVQNSLMKELILKVAFLSVNYNLRQSGNTVPQRS